MGVISRYGFPVSVVDRLFMPKETLSFRTFYRAQAGKGFHAIEDYFGNELLFLSVQDEQGGRGRIPENDGDIVLTVDKRNETSFHGAFSFFDTHPKKLPRPEDTFMERLKRITKRRPGVG